MIDFLTNTFMILSILFLLVSFCLTFLRLLIGPSLPDRVMAFDMLSVLVMCVVAVFSFMSNRSLYLDVVLVLALMAFLGTVAFSQFIEWQLSKDRDD